MINFGAVIRTSHGRLMSDHGADRVQNPVETMGKLDVIRNDLISAMFSASVQI